jgi:uncharacterized protein YqhQ
VGVRYGGQAVFEGVMMRGETSYAVAVRRPDGGIEVTEGPLPTWGQGLKDVPVVRGIVALAEALPLGFKALTWSAEHGLGQVRKQPPWWERVLTMLVVALVIVFASAAPAAAAVWISRAIGLGFLGPFIELALGVLMLYGYLRVVGKLGEVVGLFANHGAEHKVVNAYEAGAPLTVPDVQRHSTRHTRCGTSFLLVVAVISAVFFAVVGATDVVVRVAALPLIAGLAAEIQLRLAESGSRLFTRPGLALQRLTTREPTDEQVEVAIAALQAVLPRHVAEVPATA